jgi:hypothetical protein
MTHEEYVQSRRQQAAELARGILAGSMPLLEGCHALASLQHAVEAAEQDPDFQTFTLISSECDALPIGSARELWSPEALARVQPELESAIAWATPLAIPACRSIVQRFGA